MAMTDKTLAEVLQLRIDALEKRLAGHDQLFALTNKTLDEKDVRIIQLEALTSEGALYNHVIRTLLDKLVTIRDVPGDEGWSELDCDCGYHTDAAQGYIEDIAWEHVAEEHFANLGPNLAQAREDRNMRILLELEREGWDGAARIAELEKELKLLRMTERMAHQHASRRDAEIHEVDAQLAEAKAVNARMVARRSASYADVLERAVKAENERDALEAKWAAVMKLCEEAESGCRFEETSECTCERSPLTTTAVRAIDADVP